MSKRTLYESGWSPRGARKAWDRTSMDVESTVRMLGQWNSLAEGKMTEAVAWIDEAGVLRLLAATYDNGQRLLLRKTARNITAEFTRDPLPPAPAPGQTAGAAT